jgi:rRNA-processing protein FCF1
MRAEDAEDIAEDFPVVTVDSNADDTIIEVAVEMARLRSPLIAVTKDGKLHGVIAASRLLAAALKH